MADVVPLEGLALSDSDDVRWFPAVAVKDNGEKVWGDIDRAFAEFDTGMLKLEVDVTSSSDLNLLSTFDLNGKTLTVAGGTVAFKAASRVEAASAGQIITSGGSVSAELGSTFTFEPNAAWLASGLTVEENAGVWTVVYDHVCDWGMSVAGDTLTAVCSGAGTCKYGNQLILALSAADAVYDGTPKGAALDVSAAATFVAATGAEIGEVNYTGFTSAGASYDSSEAPTDTGSYRAKVVVTDMKHALAQYTITKDYAITPRPLTGVRETTYVMTVPLDSIRFYDKYGNLVYPKPEHAHEWTFAGGGTDTVTATCTNVVPPCTIPGAAVAIGLVAESRAYDGTPFAASVTNVEVFAAAIRRDVTGAVEYYDTNGVRLAAAPKLTGDYVAKFSVEAVGMTLVKAFSITKPSGGYTDGWELARQGVDEPKWVRYDTFADAAAVAADGDTIHYRDDEAINQKWYDFTSDADITVDLHGQTLRHDADGDSGFANYGDGTVTIVNADLLQPKGTWGQNVDFVGTAGKTGAFILGEGVAFRNQATTEGRRMTLEVANINLEIVGGKYQIGGISLSEGAVVSVKGGLFWSNFNPSAYVPYPYAVRKIVGDYTYAVYYR